MGVSSSVSFDFTGARVLVTGGSSGIGHATATAFARAGAIVTVTGTRAGAGEYVDVDLSRFEFVQVDTRDADAVDALAHRFDVLDVLVNNAGVSKPFTEWSPDGFSEALAVNVEGAMRLSVGCQDALASSSMPGGASIVNIVSMSAFRAVPMIPGYSSAKAALVMLTQNLAMAWVEHGIRVNALAPGLIDTPLTAPMSAFPEIQAKELARVPAGRMGTAQECSDAVLFLSSGSSAYTTGTCLAVDGGYLAF